MTELATKPLNTAPLTTTPLLTTPVGEHAVRFAIPLGASRASLLAYLRALPGVRDASVAAEHALVVFDDAPFELTLPALADDAAAPLHHAIDVIYDGADLEELAATLGISRAALIGAHADARYEVLFLGFSPGFAYLTGADARLASVPRRSMPRARVPAGSVALAGGYTGIYPAASPGGWHLLGHAPGFDPFAHGATLGAPRFAVGDTVTFVPREARA